VADQPPWAVIEACDHVGHGQASLNRSYCPNELEFCALVRKIVAPHQLQLRKTSDLLDAGAPPAEMERKTLTKPREIPPTVTKADQERRAAEQFLARCKAEAEASLRPAASVFELDPQTWDD
jgi:hypothetical protein